MPSAQDCKEQVLQENDNFDHFLNHIKNSRTMVCLYEDENGKLQMFVHGYEWKQKALIQNLVESAPDVIGNNGEY